MEIPSNAFAQHETVRHYTHVRVIKLHACECEMCVNYTKSVNQNSSTACCERELRVIRKKDWIFNFWYDFRWAWASHCASLGFLLTKTRKSRRKIIPCAASILVSFNCQEPTRNLNNWILNGVWKFKQANCELCNTATWAKKFDLLLECCQAPDLILNVCLFLQNALSSNSYASFMFSKLPACIHNSIYTRQAWTKSLLLHALDARGGAAVHESWTYCTIFFIRDW